MGTCYEMDELWAEIEQNVDNDKGKLTLKAEGGPGA